jgi:hypothetical protein
MLFQCVMIMIWNAMMMPLEYMYTRNISKIRILVYGVRERDAYLNMIPVYRSKIIGTVRKCFN